MKRLPFNPLQSLRGRWLIVQIVGLATILALASWLMYSSSRDVILSEVAKGGFSTAATLRNVLAGNVPSRSKQLQDLLLNLRADVTGIQEIFIVDRDGLIVAHNNPARVGAHPNEPEIDEALRLGIDSVAFHDAGIDPSQPEGPQAEHVQIVLPVHGKYDPERRSAIAGAVVLDVDIAAAGARIRRGFSLLLFALAALLAAFVAMQYFSLQDSYRKLAALGEATREFGQGHYDVRVDVSGPTEIRQLAEAFNAMAARVEETAEELHKAKLEAEAATKAKSSFLASVSHEMRTPLTGIIGYASLAAEEPGLSNQAKHYIEQVVKASNGLKALIEDMLDVGRIEAGKVVIRPRPFIVKDLVDTCLSIFYGAAQAKGLSLRAFCDEPTPNWLIGDDDRIRQVLLNLLSNAVKFTSAGSIEVGVQCDKLGLSEATIRFYVKDTGIGIDEKMRGQLFNRFVQADNSIALRFGGTGLGLAISKDLVLLMGGKIGVDSKPGRGSTFWFTLPLKVGQEPEEKVDGTAEGQAPLRRLRILVADDNDMNRDLVKTMLVRAGQKVDVAVDGQDAIVQFRNNRYDLILMDIRMPGIDGVEAARQIRAASGNSKVPIVAMTANVMPDQVALYRAAGMDDFLGKPIDGQELLRLLRRWGSDTPKTAPAGAKPVSVDPPVHEAAALIAVKDLLGEERTLTFLRNLRNALANLDGGPDGSDRQATAKFAHSLVSLSGQLGFTKLSGAARALEAACLSDKGIAEAMAAFKGAAIEAREVLSGMIQAPSARQERVA